jgi:hypothetical protein
MMLYINWMGSTRVGCQLAPCQSERRWNHGTEPKPELFNAMKSLALTPGPLPQGEGDAFRRLWLAR